MYEYTASGNTLVRVGQTAKENDHLTTTSEQLPKDVKRDAAVLAIHHSKTPDSNMSWVDLVRVENVSSLKQHGQVTLEGKVDQLTIFMRKEKERLERILKTQSKPLYVPAM